MGSSTRGVQDGFHEEARRVSVLTSDVAGVRDGWHRGAHVNVPGAITVSQIYADLSRLIAMYGELARKDTKEFEGLGVKIQVQDAQDAQDTQDAQGASGGAAGMALGVAVSR